MTSILGTTQTTAETKDHWIAGQGRALAARYAPDGTYQPCPPVGALIEKYCAAWGIEADGATAQFVDEAAGGQSALWRAKRNPAGLGAENSDATGTAFDKAIDFTQDANGQPVPDEQAIEAGIAAWIAHLCSYALGDGVWTPYDPRRSKMAPATVGHCANWEDLDGTWAYPGVGYGEHIVALRDQLRAFAAQQQTASVDISGYVPPTILSQPFAPNGVSYLGLVMDPWGVCVHETGNPNPGAEAQQNVDYLNSQECISREASWHQTVGHDVLIETIPVNRQAYHASDGAGGPGNLHFVAIEGVMCYPPGSPELDRVLQNHAWATARVLRLTGRALVWCDPEGAYQDGDTVGQHHNFALDHKDCPQVYRDTPGMWDRFRAFAAAFYTRDEWHQTPPDALHFAEVPYTIQRGFKGFYDMLALTHQPNSSVPASFLTFGFPRSAEFQVTLDGQPRTAQVFDTGVLLWQPDQPYPFDVRPALIRQVFDVLDQGAAQGAVDLEATGLAAAVAAWRAAKGAA